MKKKIVTLLGLAISFISHAQLITIVDATTLEPLPGAIITSAGQTETIVTNEKGNADISKIQQKDTITVSFVGYLTVHGTREQLIGKRNMIHLTTSIVGLDELVFSASKFEEKKKDVPFLVETIKAEQIRTQDNATTAELLQQSGQVFVQKSQMGGGSPVIRGFEASRILMVVDGVRMNNAIYRSGHLQNVIRVDQNMLSRVEVLFGPGAVIYGSDALGGVIHFQTKNPALSSTVKPNIKVGTFARFASANFEKTGHVDLNFGFKKWGMLTSFTFSHFDDLRQGNLRSPFNDSLWHRNFYVERINGTDSILNNPNPNIQKKSGYYQYDIQQKFLYRPSEKVQHILNFQLSNSSNVHRYDRLSEINASGNPQFAEWHYGPERRLLASYNLQLLNGGFYDQARFTIAYQNIAESRHSRRFNNVNKRSQFEEVQVASINLDFTKQIRKHELRYGSEGSYNYVHSNATTRNIITDTVSPWNTRYPAGGSHYGSAALYFSDTWEISRKIIFTFGGRFNYVGISASFTDTTFYPFPFQSARQNNFAGNGNIGLIFMPDATWRMTLLASSGFRSPNIDDLGKVFDSAPGILVVPNTDISPEYTLGGEIGISKTFAEKVRVEVIGFASYIPGRISLAPFHYNGMDSVMYDGVISKVYANQNVDNGYILGINASLHADVTKNFSILSTINYTYGKLQTGNTEVPMDHIPPLYGKTSFILKMKKFMGEFWVLYNGWKRIQDYHPSGEDNQQYATPKGMPAWFTINARLNYQIIPQIRLQLAMENILDWNYRTFASGISAPGRNLIFSVHCTF